MRPWTVVADASFLVYLQRREPEDRVRGDQRNSVLVR